MQSLKTNNKTKTTSVDFFNKITPFLEYAGFDTEINTDKIPQLNISIDYEDIFDDEDFNSDFIILQLAFIDDLIKDTELNVKTEDSCILQFLSILPIKVNSDRAGDFSLLISHINNLLFTGNFGLSNVQDGFVLNFKYSMINVDKNINELLVAEVIEIISYFIFKISPIILDFEENNINLEQAIEEVSKKIQIS